MTAGQRPFNAAPIARIVSENKVLLRVEPQRGPHLGERLQHSFRTLLRKHPLAVVIGTDSPELSVRTLLRAFRELHASDAVLGPCPDGGYYLVGMRRRGGGGIAQQSERFFYGVRWGTLRALSDTLRSFTRHGLSCALLDPLEDIDRPEDFKRLKKRMAASRPLRRRAPATWQFVRQIRPDSSPR